MEIENYDIFEQQEDCANMPSFFDCQYEAVLIQLMCKNPSIDHLVELLDKSDIEYMAKHLQMPDVFNYNDPLDRALIIYHYTLDIIQHFCFFAEEKSIYEYSELFGILYSVGSIILQNKTYFTEKSNA